MNGFRFEFHNTSLIALPSGAVFWPDQSLLCVADLHLGKSERLARRGGALLPPYETRETLSRLKQDITACDVEAVLCLGDSFDDNLAAQALCPEDHKTLSNLMDGCRWHWVEGNHDPSQGVEEITLSGLVFRHNAQPGAKGEISGHYHPKARLSLRGKPLSRPCFLCDGHRLILPAYGTYTGGLDWRNEVFADLLGPGAFALLTGETVRALPVPVAA